MALALDEIGLGSSKISKKADDLATWLRDRPPVSVVVPRDAGQWEKCGALTILNQLCAWHGFKGLASSSLKHQKACIDFLPPLSVLMVIGV